MKPQPGHPADVLAATGATLLVSAGAGLLATLPLSDGTPLSTRMALFTYTACPLVMVCVVSSEPFMRRAAERRARKARRA